MPSEDPDNTIACPRCGENLSMAGERIADFDVFVSYSNKDKDICDAIVGKLEGDGIRCWFAPRDILPGRKMWASQIIDGITNSRVMLLIFTGNSNSSLQVVREVDRAVNKGLTILPLRVDLTMPSGDLEYFISTCQWFDAMPPPLQNHLESLAGQVRVQLDWDVAGDAPPGAETGTEEGAAPWSGRPPAAQAWAAEEAASLDRETFDQDAGMPEAESPPAVSGTAAVLAEQRLLNRAPRFDFFQAVRILERAALQARVSRDGFSGNATVPVGHDGPADSETIRFRAAPTLGFPAATVLSATRSAGGPAAGDDSMADGAASGRAEMQVSFMGLTGASGVLPDHYCSLLIERIQAEDTGLADFLDLFNHRLISLFFRAWQKYRLECGYERHKLLQVKPARDAANPWTQADDLSSILLSLAGLGTGGMRQRMSAPDEAILFNAGHFARHVRGAAALEEVLSDYFEMPCKIRQFVGQWLPLDEDDRSRLPRRGSSANGFCTLGVDVVLGTRVWDVQSKFRVQAGPLTYAHFAQLLPGSSGLAQMFDLVRFYVGTELDFDVQPLLLAAEIPACRIGTDSKDPARPPNRIGRNFWLRSGPGRKDFEGAVFGANGA
jgi:type VI secretion system protein ImpH